MTAEIYELIFRGLQSKYPGQAIGPHWRRVRVALDGGDGSGNFGHEGRPGKVGGSGEGGGKAKKPIKEFLGEEFKGVKGQAAVEKLLKEKRGHVKAAFTREDIGDIDLVWGDEEQGIAHLIKSRLDKNPYPPEDILNKLTETIENGVLRRGKSGNFEIWHKGIMVIVRPDYFGEDIRFVITGFKQRGPNKNSTTRKDAV
ncbi:MAG: hypothetical protein ACI37O_02570 [Candidatus Avelusimicrobium sp.]|uniref:putative barnase/colicin E5 family endoribonuclease n=1 Tax=Candidatus Avelusimicrobium sp. TaxID=3048833 RepID=UPI003F03559E